MKRTMNHTKLASWIMVIAGGILSGYGWIRCLSLLGSRQDPLSTNYLAYRHQFEILDKAVAGSIMIAFVGAALLGVGASLLLHLRKKGKLEAERREVKSRSV